MKLALLTEIPAPYRIALFDALAERLELRVLVLARNDPRRPYFAERRDEWRFDHRFLPGRGWQLGGRWLVVNRGVRRELRSFAPDVVAVGGWNQPAFWQALVHSRLRMAPLLIWIESTSRDRRRRAPARQIARRVMANEAAGVFVPGGAAAAYARSLGVPERRIARAPNAVDDARFARAAVDRRGRSSCTFLYAGRLDPEKCVHVLLQAFESVPGRLVVVGSGSEEKRLRGLASDRVRFVGPLDGDDLVDWYATADVFVLPSCSEPWGMVLNEAAAAGLPLVATNDVGAAHDLIAGGVNGFRVPSRDPQALAAALRSLADDEAFRIEAGSRSRELVGAFTPQAWASGVASLAHRVVAEEVNRG